MDQDPSPDRATQLDHPMQYAMAIADTWRLAGRWQDALTLLNGIQPVAIELGEVAEAQHALLLGRVLTDQATFGGSENRAEREACFDRALELVQAVNDPALLGAIWDAKGFSEHAAYLDSDRNAEPPHELEYCERGLELRRQANDTKGIAESLFHLGLVYGVVRQDHKQAMPYFEEAYRLAQAVGDDVMASYAIRHVAFAHHDAGNDPEAWAGLKESLRLREEAGFVPGVAMAQVALAYAEFDFGDKALAFALLEQAKTTLAALGATPRVAMVDGMIEEFSKA